MLWLRCHPSTGEPNPGHHLRNSPCRCHFPVQSDCFHTDRYSFHRSAPASARPPDRSHTSWSSHSPSASIDPPIIDRKKQYHILTRQRVSPGESARIDIFLSLGSWIDYLTYLSPIEPVLYYRFCMALSRTRVNSPFLTEIAAALCSSIQGYCLRKCQRLNGSSFVSSSPFHRERCHS